MEFDNPVHTSALLLALVGLITITIAMDMRRLPAGRIKWVPWTLLTVLLMTALPFVAGVALQNMLR